MGNKISGNDDGRKEFGAPACPLYVGDNETFILLRSLEVLVGAMNPHIRKIEKLLYGNEDSDPLDGDDTELLAALVRYAADVYNGNMDEEERGTQRTKLIYETSGGMLKSILVKWRNGEL